jgi:hypothetical protein
MESGSSIGDEGNSMALFNSLAHDAILSEMKTEIAFQVSSRDHILVSHCMHMLVFRPAYGDRGTFSAGTVAEVQQWLGERIGQGKAAGRAAIIHDAEDFRRILQNSQDPTVVPAPHLPGRRADGPFSFGGTAIIPGENKTIRLQKTAELKRKIWANLISLDVSETDCRNRLGVWIADSTSMTQAVASAIAFLAMGTHDSSDANWWENKLSLL